MSGFYLCPHHLDAALCCGKCPPPRLSVLQKEGRAVVALGGDLSGVDCPHSIPLNLPCGACAETDKRFDTALKAVEAAMPKLPDILYPDDDEPVKHDPVNHPAHYTSGAVECIDAIEAALGADGFAAFLRGQVIKYTWRLGLKGAALEDAQKAAWYQAKLVEVLGR